MYVAPGWRVAPTGGSGKSTITIPVGDFPKTHTIIQNVPSSGHSWRGGARKAGGGEVKSHIHACLTEPKKIPLSFSGKGDLGNESQS